jgi:hypothetical protein
MLHGAKLPTLVAAPKVPGYADAATQDINNARPNQVTPWGSSTWIPPTTPGGQWTQKTSLTPSEQAALTAQQKTSAGLSTAAAAKTPWAVGLQSGPIDYNKFMKGGDRVQGGAYYNQKAGDAVYKQFADRMEPQFQRDTASMETQLRNQGLKPGDEAWNDQIRQNNQSIGDARERAREDAVQAAGAEGQRMQGMDTGAGTYNTDQRTNQIAQEMQRRGYGVNEINNLTNGQGVNNPSFAPVGGPSSPYSNAMENTYAANTATSNAKNKNTGSWMNTIGNVVKAIF